MEFIGVIVYILVSLVAAFVGWKNRDGLKAINKEKHAASTPSEIESLPASFSRTVGLVGLIFLTGFMWAIGFYVLTNSPMLKVINDSGMFQNYLLAAAALFAPYAANQIGAAIGGKQPSAPPTTRSADSAPLALTPLPPPT
jgi:hypothetical protein